MSPYRSATPTKYWSRWLYYQSYFCRVEKVSCRLRCQKRFLDIRIFQGIEKNFNLELGVLSQEKA